LAEQKMYLKYKNINIIQESFYKSAVRVAVLSNRSNVFVSMFPDATLLKHSFSYQKAFDLFMKLFFVVFSFMLNFHNTKKQCKRESFNITYAEQFSNVKEEK
jgi:hypothetical protein